MATFCLDALLRMIQLQHGPTVNWPPFSPKHRSTALFYTSAAVKTNRYCTKWWNKKRLFWKFQDKPWSEYQVYYTGGPTLGLLVDMEIWTRLFPVTAVALDVKYLSLIVQPGLSWTETALILLMTIPLPLHAASRLWPWRLAARHALSAAASISPTGGFEAFLGLLW